MSNDFKFEVIIYWSNEDEAFIAEAPELAGIGEWIETAKELGRPVPEPKGRLIMHSPLTIDKS